MTIQLKRAYEKPERNDGTRILVDRLWPRGLKKRRLRLTCGLRCRSGTEFAKMVWT